MKSELVVSSILVILLVLLVNPFDLLMLSEMQMYILVAVTLVFIIFASFVFKEQASDERENLHRYIAARFAYLIGASVILVGVIVQTFLHTLDPWLLTGLILMILGKIAGLLYGNMKY